MSVIEGGGSWGNSRHVDQATGLNDTNSFNVNGGLGGVTARRQLADRDLGIRPRRRPLLGRPARLSVDNGPVGTPAFSSFTKEDWLATVRGRVGFAANNALFYGTAGWAGAGVKSGVYSHRDGHGVRHRGPDAQRLDRRRRHRMGFPAANSRSRSNICYVALENKAFLTPNLGPGFNRSNVSLNDNIVRVGLNWRCARPVNMTDRR